MWHRNIVVSIQLASSDSRRRGAAGLIRDAFHVFCGSPRNNVKHFVEAGVPSCWAGGGKFQKDADHDRHNQQKSLRFLGGFFLDRATSYSPTHSRVQYNRG